ncbi:DUF1350 family protein [Microcoleus sp. LAD1_D3]|uniref:DUF1350 family protein n=1 Tax=Microcoleus sp. LAD1_D3 TaxID=2819365 RepID=UPI002FD151F7
MNNIKTHPKWIPLQHSFVKINPNAKGTVLFIGGYLYGTFPTWSYNKMLNYLCEKNFTVISYPYSPVQLSHWKLANDLLEEIEHIKRDIIHESERAGYRTDVYSAPDKYCFVGHSLGCECISLIQFLSFTKDKQHQLLHEARNKLGPKKVTDSDFSDVDSLPAEKPVPYKASLLMAPCFKAPLPGIRPKQELMRYAIENGPLLPLTALISFKGDDIAGEDVNWLHQNLSPESLVGKKELNFQSNLPCWAWQSLKQHLIPCYNPIESGLLDCAVEYIDRLIARE